MKKEESRRVVYEKENPKENIITTAGVYHVSMSSETESEKRKSVCSTGASNQFL